MFRTLQNLIADERGQGLAEYGLILALVAVVCIGAVQGLSGGIQGALGKASAGLNNTP